MIAPTERLEVNHHSRRILQPTRDWSREKGIKRVPVDPARRGPVERDAELSLSGLGGCESDQKAHSANRERKARHGIRVESLLDSCHLGRSEWTGHRDLRWLLRSTPGGTRFLAGIRGCGLGRSAFAARNLGQRWDQPRLCAILDREREGMSGQVAGFAATSACGLRLPGTTPGGSSRSCLAGTGRSLGRRQNHPHHCHKGECGDARDATS